MAWLSDQQIERRMRRKLEKYGYQLHKSSENGGYTVTGGPEPEGQYSDIMKLVDAVEALEERFANQSEK